MPVFGHCDASDESPFPLARADELPDELRSALQPADVAANGAVAIVSEMVGKSKALVGSTKVLQSKSRFTLLSRNKDTGKLTVFGGNTVNPLMHVERTTAVCYFQAWKRRRAVSDACELFQDRVRVVPEDGAPSNYRNERRIAQELGPEWSSIEVNCEDHLQVPGLGAFSKIIDADVTGEIHWVLMHSEGVCLIHTRRILKEVINEFVRIERGPPPTEARTRLHRLLRLCFQIASARTLGTILSVSYLPNGDPHKLRCIDIWVPVNAEVNLQSIRHGVWKCLDTILFTTKMNPI